MKIIFLISTIFLASSCSTMQYTPNQAGGGYDGVDVLYEYPSTKFKSLGVIDFDFYQPGWREPTVTDALPELKQKVRENGGNALIVRDQRIGRHNSRYITISAECLRIEK
jgi:hypothetical protein